MNILITGGAGFIGTNTAVNFRKLGHKIIILDDFSRPGSRENYKWLCNQFNDIKLVEADIRDFQKIYKNIKKCKYDVVIHLASQTAVTKSIENPRPDFEVNVLGTFNVLEALRLYSPTTILLFASTNKVYGQLKHLNIYTSGKRYKLRSQKSGIDESQSLDFHSPYGCSKGAADTYVIDYGRIYQLKTISLRQSCIYGYHQFGLEDQGWVAWLITAHLLNKPITIYGNGRQVRDILFIDDLTDCYMRAISALTKRENLFGQVFNVGGGLKNSLSILECIEYLEEISGRRVNYSLADGRLGDQKVYISNFKKAKRLLGWQPQIKMHEGIKRLYDWINGNLGLFKRVLS